MYIHLDIHTCNINNKETKSRRQFRWGLLAYKGQEK